MFIFFVSRSWRWVCISWHLSCLPYVYLCLHLQHWTCISLKLQFVPSQSHNSLTNQEYFSFRNLYFIFLLCRNFCYSSEYVQCKVPLNVFIAITFSNCNTEVRPSEWWPYQRHCEMVTSVWYKHQCPLCAALHCASQNIRVAILVTVAHWNVTEASLPSAVIVSAILQLSFQFIICLCYCNFLK